MEPGFTLVGCKYPLIPRIQKETEWVGMIRTNLEDGKANCLREVM